MIRFSVHQSGDTIVEFSVTGHSGYGELGTDIVCAGVSALVYNAVNSCEELLGIVLDTSDSKEKLHSVVPKEHQTNRDVQLLLSSLVFGVKQIAESYPSHVKIVYQQ